MTLEELKNDARKLANALFSNATTQCSRPVRCMQKEEDRPLTRAEKTKGWTRRPFWAYDPARMCAGCAAYFHAERVAQTLHEMRCWQRRAEAEQAGNKLSEKST